MSQSAPRLLGGLLLVAGTCIGAGMIALPVASAASGLAWSLCLLFGVWLVMALSGVLVAEVATWLPPQASFISMARQTLGLSGVLVSWVAYLLLLYSLMAAYLSGGGSLLNAAWVSAGQPALALWERPLLWVGMIGGGVFFGARVIDFANRLLMLGLFLSFVTLLAWVLPHVQPELMGQVGAVQRLPEALPIVVAAFGYHVVLPSVRSYLQGAARPVLWAILLGSALPLLVYGVWELAVFGCLPVKGVYGLAALRQAGQPVADLPVALAQALQRPQLAWVLEAFVFFALASSFLGVALSLFDFLADGLFGEVQGVRRLWVMLLTVLPPFIYVWLLPGGFLHALQYAGFFVAFLNGLLPVLMVWVGRRRGLMPSQGEVIRTPGGSWVLLSLGVFFLAVMGLDIFSG